MSDNDNGRAAKGKPPKSGQFTPGKSGNPKGRPKGARNNKTILEEELNIPVIVTENGKRKRITKRRAMIKHLVNKGASGNEKASAILLAETRKYEEAEHTGSGLQEPLGPNDEIVIAEIVRRIRAGEVLPDDVNTASDQNNEKPEAEQTEDSK